ncbi:DUF6308 family protein [Streptomyces sp. NPDC005840]|uniref:DUF6308 family protein n=1 Tax=Streptomyces doudnae TaxID=3075536 RepID=A0ABD5ELP7_9ACTN|nr:MULTISPECIES: DUF6308 family protein [unclassified Streptomyces]MDT0434969.1 DUF6308 family protein [Streptomyces sp. DSM 41981]SCD78254.1 hypothetical protein GA0115242_114514 [Streptomyces sp. SolWspMP-5a-2]
MTTARRPFPGAWLSGLVASDQAPRHLAEYFRAVAPGEAAGYTGSRFERLGGGGDRPETADTVTADDLVAVQTLSVSVPSRVALDLLEGGLGRDLRELLRRVPRDLDMADAARTDLDRNSPAHAAWELLRGQDKVGWVVAGKILARKRPRLVPVYDSVVRCALGAPREFWLGLHGALRADGRALHTGLLELRDRAGVPGTVGALRVCDVLIWKHHRDTHRKRGCPGV